MTAARVPFFHLRTSPGNHWPVLVDPRLGQVWSSYLTLDRTQWLPREQLEEFQLLQLGDLVRHAATHVPYYRRTFAEAGVSPDRIRSLEDFRQIPFLSRLAITDLGSDLHATELPPGISDSGTSTSSGTSGVPIAVRQTTRDQTWWIAHYLRDLEWAGIDPGGTFATFRPMKGKTPEEELGYANGTSIPHWMPVLSPILDTGPAHVMDLRQDLGKQLDWLRRVNPDYLLGYPSHLAILAERVTPLTRPGRLRAIQAIAEALSPEVKSRLEAAFGVRVIDLYSCTEAGYLASPCPQGHGMHVHAENVLLEVLDEAGKPCRPGELGRVVITCLHNYRMPFLRYDILDGAVLGAERCPCGRGLPLLTRVDGKLRPWFRLPSGERKSSTTLSVAFQKIPGLVQFQVIQRATGRFETRIVPGKEWSEKSLGKVREIVASFVEAEGWWEIEVVPEIPRTGGGKVRDFVRELPDDMLVPGGSVASPTATSPSSPPKQLQLATVSPAVTISGSSRGKTVLLGWELGGGFGHVHPLSILAQALAEDRHRPVFALRDVQTPWPMLRDLPWPVLFAPGWGKPPAPGTTHKPATFADILAIHGYESVDTLAPLVAGWDALLDTVRPDLVVCHFSPTLAVAARGRYPILDVGNGYCQPPVHLPTFPKIFHGETTSCDESRLLEVVREVLGNRLSAEVTTLPGVFAGHERCATVFPELDPYREYRREPCVGPLAKLLPPMRAQTGRRFFAYLDGAVASTEPGLRFLAESGLPGEAYIREGSPEQRDRLRSVGVVVHDRPVRLADAFERCGIIIHHGGLSTAEAALCAGRPQLLLPFHGENRLTAEALHRLGVAHVLAGEYPAKDLLTAARQLLELPRFANRSAELAEHFHRLKYDSLARIRERYSAILR